MIKKAYIEVIALLEANANKKVSSILDEVKALCEAKNGGGSDIGKTFLKDEDEKTTAVFCYYFKRWIPVHDENFGIKTGTASGLNTMCKEGNSLWTKQQRVAKQKELALLGQLQTGEITVDDLESLKAEIEAERVSIQAPTFDVHFGTAEECQAYLDSIQVM